MDYRETVDYILNIPLFARKIGTDNLASLLRRLGNPERTGHVIHVAGTNGKGSTCRILQTLLMESGYKVGLFTSPHLVSINERIQINNDMISDEDFVRCFEIIRQKFTIHPSFFEVVFAMAAVYFSMNNVDYAIYETGMGGLLDATNVVKPELTIITSIGLDHMQYLGGTISEIAAQKAGIIKPGVPICYFKRDEEAADVIEETAAKKNAEIIKVEKCQYIINVLEDKTIDFSLHNRYYSYDNLKIRRTSFYQVENACLAITAFTRLWEAHIKSDNTDKCTDMQQIIDKALMEFSWGGRMEELTEGIYVDGAHNAEAISAYVKSLEILYNDKDRILVFAAVCDKDYDTMIRLLCHNISYKQIIVTSVDSKRKADTEALVKLFKKYTEYPVAAYDIIAEAMDAAVALKTDRDNIFCVGSLYLVAGVKKWLMKRR